MSGEGLRFIADMDEDPAPPPPLKKSRKTGAKTNSGKIKAESPTLWLQTRTSTSLLGIRTRATLKGQYSHQLNLNDLLEVAMEILPQEAYALLMLVEHMFEDEEDDFACGRAYGGSRNVQRSHGWPASHCKDYIEKCIEEVEEDEEEEVQPKKKKQKTSSMERSKKGTGNGVISPMEAALTAHLSLPFLDTSPSAEALSVLWAASIIEDARQPPYLCPVDLQKVLTATGVDERESYEKLGEFCGRVGEVWGGADF
ncbi:hypothetical protein B0J14DRAFT_654618 [Halenospora varia]|nr:hypothetical protein B0J14DRAFT_654618 [Halenospora varia]